MCCKLNSKLTLLIVCISIIGCDTQSKEYTDDVGLDPSLKAFLSESTEVKKSSPVYENIDNDSKVNSLGSQPISLQWDTPPAWIEIKSKGFNYATYITRGFDPIECSITILGPEAGDQKSNIIRWMDELDLPGFLKKEPKISEFLDKQKAIKTKGGLEGIIVNFNRLGHNKLKHPSMIVAMLNYKSRIIFVKLKGNSIAIAKNSDKFFNLVHSLEESNEN